MIRMNEKYKKQVLPKLKETFKNKNEFALPRITKAVVNVGFGKLIAGKSKQERDKIGEEIIHDLSIISGQKPVLTKAKKSISVFKIRMGMPIGAKVTLRRKKMNDFLERLISIVLPRTRDFRGINLNCVDQSGNLNIGIKEQISFPEIAPENVKRIFGLEVTVVTSAKNRSEAIELFRLIGFPLKNE